LHENISLLEDLDVQSYIISKDAPEQQLELYNALKEKYGFSLPFISDPDLAMIEHFNMRSGDTAFRGYGLMDKDGKVIFKTVNDHWGEEIEASVKEIKEKLEDLK
jgi:alkyl hydroperoxide reductase subunit AhpC